MSSSHLPVPSPQSLPIKETIELLKYIQNNKLKCSISFALVCCILYNNPLRKTNENPISSFEGISSEINTEAPKVASEIDHISTDVSQHGTTFSATTASLSSRDFAYTLEHMSDEDICDACIHKALDTLIQIESSQMAKLALQDCQQILANQNTIVTRGKVAKRLKRMGINTVVTCNHSSIPRTPRNLLIPHSATPWPLQWTSQIWQDWMPH